MSSFKPKHKKLSESHDFIKIGDMAVINLNNMFPDGKHVSQERYDELMSLRVKFDGARNADDSEDPLILIEEMKQTLIDEYGDEAYDYFGDTELEYVDEIASRASVSNRNIAVELTDPNYIGWAETT